MEDVKTHKIILHNDDKNSFTYVMACLIRFCEHQPVQAEQCALIAHNVGRAHLKQGDIVEIQNYKDILEKEFNIKTEIKQTKNA